MNNNNYMLMDASAVEYKLADGSTTSVQAAITANKQIKLWVSGEIYEENDFVSYNDYIYRCKIANSDADFVEDNWEKQSDTHVEITKQEILNLLGLTNEELETMAQLIDDNIITTNKTHSSSKIYTDIQQCLQDSKNFTLEELGKKIGASYEVVTSIDDMVSQDYLYLLNNDNGYDIYIVDVDNTPIVIGDTTIDLSSYATKTELERELGIETLGTTSQTVKGAINELFQSVTNVEECLDEIIAKIYYISPSITSFTCNPSKTSYEMGEKVTSITFTWTYNKDMVSQTLTGCDLADETVRTATYSTEFNSNKTFTLSASDGTNSTSTNKSFTFQNKVHHGSASIPATYDSAFILSLNGTLKGNKNGTYTTNVGNGQYFYIAMPTFYNNSDVLVGTIGGFSTEFGRVSTVSHTNQSGYTTNYNIYKSTNHSLGSITMVI